MGQRENAKGSRAERASAARRSDGFRQGVPRDAGRLRRVSRRTSAASARWRGSARPRPPASYKGRKPSVDAAKVRELRAAASAPPRSPSVSGLVARASTVLLVHEVEDAERAHGALGRSPCRRQGQGTVRSRCSTTRSLAVNRCQSPAPISAGAWPDRARNRRVTGVRCGAGGGVRFFFPPPVSIASCAPPAGPAAFMLSLPHAVANTRPRPAPRALFSVRAPFFADQGSPFPARQLWPAAGRSRRAGAKAMIRRSPPSPRPRPAPRRPRGRREICRRAHRSVSLLAPSLRPPRR